MPAYSNRPYPLPSLSCLRLYCMTDFVTPPSRQNPPPSYRPPVRLWWDRQNWMAALLLGVGQMPAGPPWAPRLRAPLLDASQYSTTAPSVDSTKMPLAERFSLVASGSPGLSYVR